MRALLLQQDRHPFVEHIAHWSGTVLEVAGIGTIIVGALLATAVFARRSSTLRSLHEPFEAYRRSLGRAILLGLEFLVAADIIGTVLVDMTFYNLGVLAILVLIRTFLSFTLNLEVERRWPWQKEPAPAKETR